jgi:hypothetical protein
VQGKIADFSIPDIFQLVSSQQKSGSLTISGDGRELVFLFSDGRIVDVHPGEGRSPSGMLGTMLVDAGVLTPEEMRRMRSLQERTGKKLGELLVEQKKISREDLARYLYLQVKESLYFALRIKEGEYRFEGFAVRPPAWASSIRPEILMMEGMQFLDEYQIFRDKLPSGRFQIARRKGAADEAASLSEEERRVWEAMDFSSDPWRVFRRAGMTWFEGIKALCALQERGLAKVTPVAEERPAVLRLRGSWGERLRSGWWELVWRRSIGILRAISWAAAAAAVAWWIHGILLSPQAARTFSGWTVFFE